MFNHKPLFRIKEYARWMWIRFGIIIVIGVGIFLMNPNIIFGLIIVVLVIANIASFYLMIASDNLRNLRLLQEGKALGLFYDNLLRLNQSKYLFFNSLSQKTQIVHLQYARILLGYFTNARMTLLQMQNKFAKILKKDTIFAQQYYLQLCLSSFYGEDKGQFTQDYAIYMDVFNRLPAQMKDMMASDKRSLHSLCQGWHQCFVEKDVSAISMFNNNIIKDDFDLIDMLCAYTLFLFDQENIESQYQCQWQKLASIKSDVFFIEIVRSL